MLSFLVSLLLLHPVNGSYVIDNAPFLRLADTHEINRDIAPQRINPENIGVKVTADKYLALDVTSGAVLAERNAHVAQPLASITKLMTALVVLDQEPKWTKRVDLRVSDETVGAYPHIYRGEEVTFKDIWKSALISSDNNSIMAMVRTVGLTPTEFVDLMNLKAAELGLTDTHFDDPTGLSTLNTSTATDIAKLVYYTMQRNEIRETVIQSKYSFPILNSKKQRNIASTDILLNSFLNDDKYGYELVGGKTGFLNEAGYCLAVQITHENHPVIIVVLNSDDIDARFQDTKVLADWVYGNYSWEKVTKQPVTE